MAAPLFQNPRALANDGPRIRAATTDDALNFCPVMRRAVGVDSAHPTDLTLLNQTSELPPETDINTAGRHVSKVPILLQKSFWEGERKFLEPLMRFARGEVRDHIASSEIDHGPP